MGYTLPDGTKLHWEIKAGRRGSSSADVWDTATWDNASWDGGSDVDFRDIPENVVFGFSTNSGKDKFGKRFKASSVSMRLNNATGAFTGVNGLMQSGDYLVIEQRITLPGGLPDVPIPDGFTWPDGFGNTWTNHGGKVLMDDTGVPLPTFYPMWFGRIDEGTDIVRGGTDTTRIVGYDMFSELAAVDKAAQPDAGAGEDVFARVLRIGNNASTSFGGITTSPAPGEATMQATTLARNALEEMQLSVESEGGDMWSDRIQGSQSKGAVAVRGRDWLTVDTRSTVVQWTLSNAPGAIPLVDAQITREQQLLVNDATFSNVNGTAQNSQDVSSIQRYGHRTFRRLDLIAENDSQAQFLATRHVANLRNIRPRIRQATVEVVDAKSALFGVGVEFGDLVQTTVNSVNGWAFTAEAHVIGISHIVSNKDWQVVLHLSDAFIDNIDGSFNRDMYSEAFRLGTQP